MIEDSLRGGLSFVGKRYIKANNQYMVDFNPLEKTTYNLYLDANNLYGYSMCEPLPFGNFMLLDKEKQFEDFYYLSKVDSILQLDPYGKKCYFYKIDGYIPESLHDHFSDFPLFPEKMEVEMDMFSEFQRNVFSEKDLKSGPRLMSTLTPKKDYVVHYRMLQFALKHGFVLTNVSDIIVCDQDVWLKGYIEKNNALRAHADLDNEQFKVKNFKNMNNMFYGKTVEQVRNRTNIVLKSNDNEAQRIVSRLTFKRSKPLNNELLLIETTIKNLVLNKPIYIGATVLELAKLRMYEFFYDKLKTFYNKPNQVTLLYSDTDSFIVNINTHDVYMDMLQPTMIDEFDFSSYSSDSIQFSNVPNFNEIQMRSLKVLGKMKDELGDFVMDEFVGLRSKLYSYTIQLPVTAKPIDNTQFYKLIKDPCFGDRVLYMKIVAKGVREYVQEKHISFTHYINLLKKLESGEVKKVTVRQTQIRSKDHNLSTQSVRKVALSACDTKRYLVDAINTLPFGHFKTNNENLM